MKTKLLAVTLSLLMVMASFAPSHAATQLTDIEGNWAQKEIQYFVDQGIIVGYGDGSFSPNQSVTRAEFVRIVNNTFKFNEPASIAFKDVKQGDWFYNDVRYAVKAGFISGYADNTFRPNNKITREEVASIIQRILKLPANTSYAPSVFSDVAASSHYNGAIGALTSVEVMKGTTESTFSPRANETRADTAYSLYNARFYSDTDNTIVDGNVIVRSDSFGPSSEYNKETYASVTVKSSHNQTTIRNIIITGNLVLEETAKRIYLENVTIKGKLIVNGGESLYLETSEVQDMDVNNAKEKIAVSVSNDSVCYNSSIYTSCSLTEDSDAYARGFSNVVVNENLKNRVTLDLSGQFVAVDIYAPETTVTLNRGQISDLYFNHLATSSTVSLKSGAHIENIEVNAEKVSIKGSGTIAKAKIEAPNATFQIAPGTVTGSFAPKYTSDVEDSNVVITVVNRSGAPVNSATVKIYGTTKTTDSEGKASFINIPSGTQEYSVEKSGFTTVSGTIDVSYESIARTVTLSGKSKYTLSFSVTDNATNSSVGSANVSLKNVTSSSTSSNGSVTFTGLESGVYTYTITKSGYQTTTDTVTISSSNQSKSVKLVPTSASYDVELTVRNSTGDPVKSASVKVGSKTGTTNSSGYVKITGLSSGSHSVTITASGYSDYKDTLNVTRNMSETVTLTGTTYSVTINVISGKDSINGAYVTLNDDIKKTGSSGKVTFTGLVPGKYSIEIEKDGYERYSDNITVQSANIEKDADIIPLDPDSLEE